MFLLCCGNSETDEEKAAAAMTPVWLHVYDVGHAKIIQNLDFALKDFLHVGGVFHGAVEVFNREWSFGGIHPSMPPRSGVFAGKPRCCRMHTYKQSIYMGDCKKHPQEVKNILMRLMEEWQAHDYNLLRRNCCSFSRTFVEELGVGPVPGWLNRLARTGAALSNAQMELVHEFHHLTDRHHEETQDVVRVLANHHHDSINQLLPVGAPPPLITTVDPEVEMAHIHVDVDPRSAEEEEIVAAVAEVAAGVLHCVLVRAAHVIEKDPLSKMGYHSDPYAEIVCGGESAKSHVVKNNLNPDWNEEELAIPGWDGKAEVTLTIRNHNDLHKDDFLGALTLDPAAIFKARDSSGSESVELKLSLAGRDGHSFDVDRGFIIIRLSTG